MNHNFQDSTVTPGLCAQCTRPLVDHTEKAVCQNCETHNECEDYDGILLCARCRSYETSATGDALKAHLEARDMRMAFRKEQTDSIKISTDIFNAHTIAIHSIKVKIDADPAIINKDFALAQLIESRFLHLKDIIFGKRKEVVEAENEQKAIQVYYNELAKKLRTEERERIRLKDVQYQPLPVVVKKAREIKIKKYDADGIKRVAADTGVNAAILQMLCVANDISPVEAARLYKETASMVKK